jgi:NADPH:quinone reductase-like Zn-dependent oxidoreductase
LSRFVRQNLLLFLARRNPADLAVLRDLLETGRITPVLDRSYRLPEAAAALRYLEEGHARGKIVVTM